MPDMGFAAPGVLFPGVAGSPERRYYRYVFDLLRTKGYTRYVELCAGGYAATISARAAGYDPAQIEVCDVSLYTTVLGTLFSGGDLAGLDVRLDGQPLTLPDGTPAEQAAYLLYIQLRTRMEARARSGLAYWLAICDDTTNHEPDHRATLARQLAKMDGRLHGLTYRAEDMWSRLEEALADPHALIFTSPPTYAEGYEKFYATDGRLTWAEPAYTVFDPEADFGRLADVAAGGKAILLALEECEPRQHAAPRPVFATPQGSRMAYVTTNRPDEVLAMTGGPKVSPKSSRDLFASKYPPMPPGHDITPASKVQLIPVKSGVSDYYRDLWLHRLAANSGSYNLLVVIDGWTAGVLGYSIDPMARPYSLESKWGNHLLLRYGCGAPHNQLRTGRLMTMIALQYDTIRLALGVDGPGMFFLAAADGLITMNMTRFPESKEMRSIMKLVDKQPHPDGYKLTYRAGISHQDLAAVINDWLRIEQRWRKQRAASQARAGKA